MPAFERLLELEDYKPPRYYQRVVALAALGTEARCNALAGLLPAP